MKKKKIIILIMIVIGILLIILATFFQKSVNIKQEYESIIYIYQGNVLQINNYNNFLKIKNDSNYDKTISKIILKFNNKNGDIIEEISINIGKIPANKEIKKSFESKKNLTNATSFTIVYNNETSIEKEYRDDNILINDFLEIDSKYLFNLTNISKAKFKTNKLTIEYLDIEKQVILSRKFAVDLDISQTATISTLKDGSEILKVQYIRIVDY